MECVVWYVKIQGRLDDIEFKKSRYTTLTFMLLFCSKVPDKSFLMPFIFIYYPSFLLTNMML